jgi:hypothetical protein
MYTRVYEIISKVLCEACLLGWLWDKSMIVDLYTLVYQVQSWALQARGVAV